MSAAPLHARVAFVVELARRLHQYGTAAPRLEQAIDKVSRRLGLNSEVWSSPTAIILSFSEAGGDGLAQMTQVMRLPPGDVHLARLCQVDAIADRVIAGELGIDEGARRLRALAQPAGRGALAALVASYGLAAGAIATLLHTSWADIAVAGAIGVLIGLIAVAGAARPRLAAAGEAIAALVATLLATLLSAFVVPLAIRSVVLAALIVLMPGMTLTTAVRELSSQHLVSGVARMSGALATLLKLTFGAVAATQLCRVLGVQPPLHALAPVPAWTEWPAVLVAAFSFAILFQAARRDWLLVMAAVAISYAAARAGGATFGAPFGVFIGGLLIGGLSNAYARWAHRPGALVREPGIILLVPGSVGFRSVSYLLERDVTLGMDTGLLLLTLLVALVAGLLFGDLVVAPRRSL
ncbi:hypothetical protein MBSD_n0415 [Mizugakiibacter sediminis]|uniref:Threonine/serine exporter family protein n=2 Tax=Mizugakiibacter sediminis TaxID=1475481 RepID=A0A0K8QKA7_9GAMM|nr:threonine/serine exporter family protein [Mizugakiibacter sediminis]GAP65126.1 hypothetical protein MBSD_n0415 [Mizugakiibacter sediminis]